MWKKHKFTSYTDQIAGEKMRTYMKPLDLKFIKYPWAVFAYEDNLSSSCPVFSHIFLHLWVTWKDLP